MKTALGFISGLLAVLAAATPTSGKSYYVNDADTHDDVYCSAKGDPRNDGLSPKSPKASVQGVLKACRLKGGDRVYVDTGRYRMDSRIHIRLSGKPGNYICFIGSTHPKGSVLSRSSTRPPKLHNCVFCIEGSQYVSVENFVCEGGHAGIIVCRRSRHVTVRDNLVRKGNRADAGIALMGDVDDCLVEGNVVCDRSSGITVNSTDPYAGRFAGHCEGNVVRGNVVYNCTDGISIQGTRKTQIVENAVKRCSGSGILVGSKEPVSQGCVVKANMVTARGASTVALRVEPGCSVGLVSDRNRFVLGEGAALGLWLGQSCPDLAAWRKKSKQDLNSVCRITRARKKHDDAKQPFRSVTNSVRMKFMLIPRGKFWMGSPEGETGRRPDESPRHPVRLSRGFYLSATEVTQGQWVRVMDSRPWAGKPNVREGEDYPAVHVSWNEAVQFCKRLSAMENRKYRLPTEAEWEYACRAGKDTLFSFGNDCKQLGDFAWYKNNALKKGEDHARQVGRKKPNRWGLHDMHGNVREWCADWIGTYPRGPATDPTGPATGQLRVVRGGSWDNGAKTCRCAYRGNGKPDLRGAHYGFRVALTIGDRRKSKSD